MNARIFLVMVISFCVVFPAAAQTKSSATQVITFSVKITPKVTVALLAPSPVGTDQATSHKAGSIDVGSATLDAAKAANLIAEIRSGNGDENRRIDSKYFPQQSEGTFSSVDRTLVFTVSE